MKTAVRQYTKRSGTIVRAHYRRIPNTHSLVDWKFDYYSDERETLAPTDIIVLVKDSYWEDDGEGLVVGRLLDPRFNHASDLEQLVNCYVTDSFYPSLPEGHEPLPEFLEVTIALTDKHSDDEGTDAFTEEPLVSGNFRVKLPQH